MLLTAQRSVSPGFMGNSADTNRLLAANFNINALRTLDTLTKEEWLLFDAVVVEERARRSNLVSELRARGLTFGLPNALGHLVMQWNTMSEMEPAVRHMDPTVPENDRVDFLLNTLPIYTTFKGFHIDIRTLAASRNRGEPLDTSYARMATRSVVESINDAFVNGPAITAGGGTAYGLLNHPNRNTDTFSATSWDNAATTGDNMLTDVIAIVDALKNDRFYGPYVIVVGNTADNNLNKDFKANSDKTIRQRLLEVRDIEAIIVDDHMPAAEIVAFQTTNDVVEIVDGEAPTLVEWSETWGQEKFKVFAIQVPRVRSDYSLRSGIVHMS